MATVQLARSASLRSRRGHLTDIHTRRQFATALPDSALKNLSRPDQQKQTHRPQRLPPTDRTALDDYVLSNLRSLHSAGQTTPLSTLMRQYKTNRGQVLEDYLPYESTPSQEKRVDFESGDPGVLLVAHAIAPSNSNDAETVIVCSGFPIRTQYSEPDKPGRTLVVSCTHTIDQVVARGPHKPSSPASTLLFTSSGVPVPVTGIPSALPRRDLALFSISFEHESLLRPMPVSPYPAVEGTALRLHCSTEDLDRRAEWTDWVGGCARRRWTAGSLLNYKDGAWRDAKPGTYDDLAHMLFWPPPTGGSSGGPVVDEQSGAIVGAIVGDRMDNIRGQKGWGIPAEAIFEMFSLPGLILSRNE